MRNIRQKYYYQYSSNIHKETETRNFKKTLKIVKDTGRKMLKYKYFKNKINVNDLNIQK